MMEPDSLRTVVGAMRFFERKQEALSHNLANVSTRGFKAERVFARLLEGAGPTPQAATDFTGGGMQQTGGDLDLALDGDGFLVVETEGGTRLSRGGSFRLDSTGTVVDESGARLMGRSGAIVLPAGEVEITDGGVISVDGEVIDSLHLEGAPAASLRREDGVYFIPEASDRSEAPRDLRVRQGHLEQSNVDPVESMVEMIGVQRAYESLQRSAQALDDVKHTISSDIARIE